MTTTEARLPRLLALVPYIQAHPGIAMGELADDFGVSTDQVRKDLDLLWMCGLPGHSPGDLIDLSYEGDTVSISFDAGMSRPLRLTGEEALALVVALRALAETPGITDGEAVQRALAKVEAAAGGAVVDTTVAVSLDASERYVPLLHRAVAEQRAVAMRYYAANRDQSTERTVDPLRIFDADGHRYLEAWCRQAEGMRVFRIDRVEEAVLLDEPSRPPEGLELRDLGDGVYQPAAEHLLVVLQLAPTYVWVADYYAAESVNVVEGGLVANLRVSEPAWVRALVLGSEGQVAVLSPQWLVDAIRQEARTALAAYRGK